jgi:hypothetical protein
MKYLKTKNMYKASNFEFYCDDKKAYSYGWWQFTGLFNCYLVFNNTTYSVSTTRHQSKAWGLLNYKSDMTLHHTNKSLSEGLESVLIDEIKGIQYEIKSLIDKVMSKGTKKAANEKRMITVNNYLTRINNIIKFARDTQGIDLSAYHKGFTAIKDNNDAHILLYPTHQVINDKFIYVK